MVSNPIASDEYITAVSALYHWKYRNGDNYTSLLFTLRSKADPSNIARLELAYPVEMKVFLDWQNSPNEKKFFDLEK